MGERKTCGTCKNWMRRQGEASGECAIAVGDRNRYDCTIACGLHEPNDNPIRITAEKLAAEAENLSAVLVVIIRHDGTQAYSLEAPDPVRLVGALEYVRHDIITRNWGQE